MVGPWWAAAGRQAFISSGSKEARSALESRAGTNSGSVFAYALEVPAAVAGGEKRPERAVEAVLGKEVQLMHRAPVVAIAVLDGRGRPLPEPYEASRDLAQAPDMQGGHAVLIASEEQFKVSSLRDPLGFSPPGCRRTLGLHPLLLTGTS